MLSSGFRLCRLFSAGSFGKPTQLSSVRCLKTFRLLFPHSSCSTVQICSHSRKLHDKKVETHQEQHHTEEDTKTGSNEGTDQGKEIKLSQRQRLKKVFAEYGATAVVFHISMSLTSLGICYTALKSGVDVPGALQKIGFSKSITDSSTATGAGTFVVAYACYKVFAPVRMFITITCTPLIVQKLRKMGILKMPAAKQ